jgi:hypothetical protein
VAVVVVAEPMLPVVVVLVDLSIAPDMQLLLVQVILLL